MIGDYNDETNSLIPHKLLLTDRQVSNLCKAFVDNSSANIKLSKTQLSEIIQSRELLGRLFRPLMRVGIPSMKNILKRLAKGVLKPSGLIAVASAADIGIYKNIID